MVALLRSPLLQVAGYCSSNQGTEVAQNQRYFPPLLEHNPATNMS